MSGSTPEGASRAAGEAAGSFILSRGGDIEDAARAAAEAVRVEGGSLEAQASAAAALIESAGGEMSLMEIVSGAIERAGGGYTESPVKGRSGIKSGDSRAVPEVGQEVDSSTLPGRGSVGMSRAGLAVAKAEAYKAGLNALEKGLELHEA